jgi:ADP-dependent NAD(P)H-hydrate dehydratase
MSGAACLSATAALRGGAGLVTLAVPEGILPIVATFEPSYLTLGLPEDGNGRIRTGAMALLNDALSTQSAVAIGPGLGQSAGLLDLVGELYSASPLPMVVDADALNLLAKRQYLLPRAEGAAPRILTPHPGEFSRLTGLDVNAIQQDRQRHAIDFAQKHNVVVVLKGQGTIITDGVRLTINTTGNSGMASGGTGDVLTGLIAGLLAQRFSPFEAAHLGAHVHGVAGDLAAEVLSKPGLIASDLLHYLGRAWCELGL